MGDVLFLAHRVPFPPDRGDKIRSFHLLRHLSARTRVHLAAFADDPRDLDHPELALFAATRAVTRRTKPQFVAGIEALVSGRPLSLTAFDDAAMRRAVEEILTREPIDTIFVFSSQMAQYVPASARQHVVMDFVDMDSAKFAAYAEAAKGPMRWMLAREARLLQAHEAKVADRAAASLLVSSAEAALFRDRTGAQRVHAIENGIDSAHFDPHAAFDAVQAAGPLIVFTGQMDYRPNVEAVTWFAEAILPKVREAHPGARFAIVGRSPGDAVKALAYRPGVIVTGEVPDVRGWLAAASAVVAPLKLARGVQNKVLEAMAMGRPVVASVAAAEGIDHAGTIEVGTDESDMAARISALIAEPERAASLGAAARRRVVEHYGWDARLAPLDALVGLDTAQSRRSAA